MESSLTRFSNRAAYYIRYRPRYPRELIPHLAAHCGLTPDSTVADVGSGTGFLAELFLRNGNTVFGIEPNPEMRLAGEQYLRQYSKFRSINGTAEATRLPDNSCGFVSAGQSFHWFDIPRARAEFLRILEPGGQALLVWNDRTAGTPFLRGYEGLVREFGIDYKQVDHRNLGPESFAAFFGSSEYHRHSFEYEQPVDYQTLEGRLLSASYTPLPDHPRFASMIEALKRLFDQHASGGTVTFRYRTQLYTSVMR